MNIAPLAIDTRAGIASSELTPVRRVLVVFGPGRHGNAALREAGELAAAGAALSVVTLAPQADPRCCGPGPGPYNLAMREEAGADLDRARRILGPAARKTTFATLAGCPDPPLADWAAARRFDLILLPAQRLGPGGGRLARELRRATTAEIRTSG